MPPPGIPAWLYPGAIMHHRVDHRYLWVQYVGFALDTGPLVNVRAAQFGPDAMDQLRVSVVLMETTVSELERVCAPVYVGPEQLFATNPPVIPDLPDTRETFDQWADDGAPPPFTMLPLTGFTRITGDPIRRRQINEDVESFVLRLPQAPTLYSAINPPESEDAGLDTISTATLVGAIHEGNIRLASPPRLSPLGGLVVVVRHEGPSAYVMLNRTDLGLGALQLDHDEQRAVRVIGPVPDVGIEDLAPVPGLRELARDMMLRYARTVPTPEDVSELNELLAGALSDPDFRVTPPIFEQLVPGTILVSREDPTMRIGVVLGLTRTVADGSEHAVAQIRLDPSASMHIAAGVMGIGGVFDIDVDSLLAIARPAQNRLVTRQHGRVTTQEIEGGVLEHVQDLLNSQLTANMRETIGQMLESLPRKPAPTSFERILADDEDDE